MTNASKLALITGASRGLGAALAEALAPTHHIVAVAKTTGALEELDDRIKALGGSATLAPMDITVPEAMATLCRGIHDRWGSLDIWAHTAIHAAPLTPTSHIDSRDMAKSITANITATATLINYVAPCWAPKARRCSLTTRARARNSLAAMARPRRRRSRWPAAGRPKPPRPAPAS